MQGSIWIKSGGTGSHKKIRQRIVYCYLSQTQVEVAIELSRDSAPGSTGSRSTGVRGSSGGREHGFPWDADSVMLNSMTQKGFREIQLEAHRPDRGGAWYFPGFE